MFLVLLAGISIFYGYFEVFEGFVYFDYFVYFVDCVLGFDLDFYITILLVVVYFLCLI